MTAATQATQSTTGTASAPKPRFGGILWRLSRATTPMTMGLAGKRWNPTFAVVEHVGRKSGRRYAAPIAARRKPEGFVISLAFGAQVDWYRNLIAAGGGTIRWRGQAYAIGSPERIDPTAGRAAFHPIQRFLLGIAGVDGYVRVQDARGGDR